jgi:serine/threonine protein kinase
MEKATLQPGDRVGHYVVERQVAVGGSAVVYQARDPKARRNVAVKVLAAHGTAGVHGGRRLLHEARSYTRLVHPRIVTLYEVGELDGVPYLVMEWVDGVTLAERLESARWRSGSVCGSWRRSPTGSRRPMPWVWPIATSNRPTSCSRPMAM